MKKTKLFLALFGLLAGVAQAGTFNLFQPANGLLKGQSSTYVTTAATSSDVIATWSGVCSSSTYLRGDGTCAAAAISGAALTKTDDTNVTLSLGGSPTTALVNATSLTLGWTGTLAASRGGLGMSTVTDDTIAVANGTIWQSKAVPDCDTATSVLQYDTSTNAFSCGTNASPAGAALTKTDDTNVTLTLGGSPTTALVNAASITAGWTGQLSAARGGTGLSTVTDDTTLVANGTTWQSKALTDCDAATSAVTYDTTTNAWGCNTINGATGANPTASLGLSAVNGSALTFMRSDAAPALDQAIAPTWTGRHTFASGTPQTFWSETDQTTDEKNWATIVSAKTYTLRAYDDATSGSRSFLTVARGTGVALSSISLGDATGNPTYSFLGTGSATFGGTGNFTQTLSGVTQAANIYASTTPGVVFNDTDAGTDAKHWVEYASGNTRRFTAYNEAASVERVWLQANRSANAISSVTLGNSTDNPAFTFSGTGAATFGGRIIAPNGSAGAPAFSFSADTSTDTGIYRNAEDQLAFTTGGTRRGYFYNAGLVSEVAFRAADGNAGAPGITFDLDADTGMYRGAVNTLSFSAGGAVKLGIDTGALTFGSSVVIKGQDGAVGAPFYSFEGDADTGFYRGASGSMRYAADGTLALNLTSSGAYTVSGNASNPVWSFISDSDTGLYNIGANSLGVTTGGVARVAIDTAAVTTTLPMQAPDGSASAPAYAFANDTNSGVYSVGADSVGVSAGGTVRLTVASGGTTVGSPTGGAQGNGTINATGLYINGVPVSGGATETGSFTGTTTGMTTSPTCTVKYRKTGQIVYIYTTTNDCQGTSNANTLTMTGLPAGIQPARGVACTNSSVQNNGTSTFGSANIGGGITAGTIQFNKANVSGSDITFGASLWTSSGTKGPTSTWSCQYDLDN